MNSQIKSVTIAAIIGLMLSSLAQLSSVLTRGYVSPLDRFNPFNMEILLRLGYFSFDSATCQWPNLTLLQP